MANDKHRDQAQPFLQIAGKPATKQEAQRILGARAIPTVKDERATKPIQTVSRPFSILK